MSTEERKLGFWPDSRPKRAGAGLVILATLALLVLPLRGLCHPGSIGAAQAVSHHQVGYGDSGSVFCCTDINDRALVNSLAPDLSGGPSSTVLLVVLLAAPILFRSLVRAPRLAGAPPPPPRSYYARSARILR
jgi:hypothetical protein